MATKDGLAQIWYTGANGVITGNTPNADNVVSVIIDEYNEHFGTDIQIWTPETKTLQVGDAVPNWNAYEKILLDLLNVKFSNGCFGQKFGNKLYIVTSNGSNQIVVNVQDGIVVSLEGPVLDETAKTQYIYRMRSAGFRIQETLAFTLPMQVGDYVDGWSEMKLVY